MSGINLNYLTPYSSGIINLINGILVPVLMAVAFIVFLWGVYKYFIYHGASESGEKMEGRKYAMWGIIGFVIILSVWGLVAIVRGALGLPFGGSGPTPPTFGVPSGNTGGNAGGGLGASCRRNTDCALGFYCAADVCVPR
ncbi:MAG: pilin [bacterium]|nr:pilin [bacterium]